MRSRLTSEEKLALINEFYQSNMSINKFSVVKKVPVSTFSTWLRLYKASLSDGPNDVIHPNEFYNVTSIAKTNPKEFIDSTNLSTIKLELNGLKLEFDIKNLKDVLEVLHA